MSSTGARCAAPSASASVASERAAFARPSTGVLEWRHAPLGLTAFLVVDDATLGPAAGGIRTLRYPDESAALADARRLARAMTLKCALAGLPAGGAKLVVMDTPALAREAAFEWLGERIEALEGGFRTAGDLGTTSADLAALARRTRYVHTNEPALAAGAARGLLACVDACAAVAGLPPSPARLSAAVQGCGTIGAAVARALAGAGAAVQVADLRPNLAEALASEIGGAPAPAEAILTSPVDILSPCAAGGVITPPVAEALRARLVCGAANNILASPAAGEILHRRSIAFVPDVIASAGAVVEGLGETLVGLDDRTALIEALGETARGVLEEARATDRTPAEVAEARALERLEAAGAPSS